MGLNNSLETFMTDINPHESDAVLGGNNTPPIDAAILGGVIGQKRRLAHKLGVSLDDELFDQLFQQISDDTALKSSRDHKLFEFETFTINSCGEVITRTNQHAFYYTEELGNNVNLDMVYIPAGSFLISYDESKTRKPIICPVTHKSFYIAKYPTTQAQYMAVMDNNPSNFQGDDHHPVGNTTWNDAIQFCQKLSNLTGREYRLPDESQWEYACRAGTTTPFYCGDTITTEFANYDGREQYADEPQGVYLGRTTPVGKYSPNDWGLYDMHGNVWEWCYESLLASQDIDSHGRIPGILRGGSWCYVPQGCSSSEYIRPTHLYQAEGFRVCTY
jgi:eukaryotic-like serine/threonine-protein kinase